MNADRVGLAASRTAEQYVPGISQEDVYQLQMAQKLLIRMR